MFTALDVEREIRKSPEFHSRRRRGIGGSDAPTIMSGDGEKLYRLWEEKRGAREPDDLSDSLPVLMGIWTEPANLFWFAKKTGLRVTRCGESIVATDHPFMAATLDGFVAEKNAVLQCKHVGGFEPFETVIERYTPQLSHEMIVTGARLAYFSVFIGSGSWRCEQIAFDPFYAAALLEREAEFWDCVQTGRPPCAAPPLVIPAGECSRVVDMSSSNSWAANAGVWRETKEAAVQNAAALKELKSLVESDVKRAHGHGVEINRSRSGALLVKETKS